MALNVEADIATGNNTYLEISPVRENPLLRSFRENGGLEKFLDDFHRGYSNLEEILPAEAYEELRTNLLPILFTRIAFPYLRDSIRDRSRFVVHSPTEFQRLYANYGFPMAQILEDSFGRIGLMDEGCGISAPSILVTANGELQSLQDIEAVGVYTITGDRRKIITTQYYGFELDRTQSEKREPILLPNTQFILAIPQDSPLISFDEDFPSAECIVIPISRDEMAQFLDQHVLYPYAPMDLEIPAVQEDIDNRSFEEVERARDALNHPRNYSLEVRRHAQHLRQQGIFDPPKLINER